MHGEIMTAVMVFIKLQPLHSDNEYLQKTDIAINLFANPLHLTHNRYNFHNHRLTHWLYILSVAGMALMKPTSRQLLLTRTPQCQSRRHPGG